MSNSKIRRQRLKRRRKARVNGLTFTERFLFERYKDCHLMAELMLRF